MKRVITIASLAAISTAASAFDYKINLEGRADFVNGKVETDARGGGTTTEKYNNFSNNLIRLNLMGNINDNLSYRFRYRFSGTAANPTSTNSAAPTLRETATTAVDYFYIDHKNEYFTTRFGKQNWVDAAGRESYVSGTDVFIATDAFSKYKSATGFGSDYRYGVSFIGKIAETNILTLALSNPNTTVTDTAGTDRKNTGVAMGGYYNGQFFNKAFQPTLGYTLGKQNGDAQATTATQDADFTLWNAGFRSEFANFVVDADYKVFEREDTLVGAGNNADESTSIYASIAYNMGEFMPIAYYVNDEYDSEVNSADFDRDAFAAGVFWKPFADVNFRYHLMYSHDTKEFGNVASTNTEVSDNRFWFGFKADI